MQIQTTVARSFLRAQYLPAIVPVLLKIGDVFVIAGVGFAVYFVRISSNLYDIDGRYVAAITLAAVAYVTVFEWRSAYKPSASGSASSNEHIEIGRALWAWTLSMAVLLLLAFGLKITAEFSRLWSVVWLFGTAFGLVACRLIAGPWLLTLARSGVFAKRAVIYGADEQGRELAKHLEKSNDLGIQLLGFIDDRNKDISESAQDYDLDVIGDTDDLIQMIQSGAVQQVIITLPGKSNFHLQQLTNRLALTSVQICLAPFMPGISISNRQFTQVADVPVLELFNRPISGWSFLQKEIEDRVLAGMLLVFVAPLLAIIAVAVKIDSPGPLFFRQMRYGYNNRLISVWKFRTMYTNMTDVDCTVQTVRNDPRVTRVGRFLRRSSLDELPQLFNVLGGTMSLVGPRPHALQTKAAGKSFEDVVERYAARHRVKPGITGWAQINGYRGETDTIEKIRRRVEYDLYYIDNWSIWLDFYILLRTLWVVLRDDKAY